MRANQPPIQNKLLQKHWEERALLAHHARLSAIKPRIDTQNATYLQLSQQNRDGKKQLTRDLHILQIQRDNDTLVRRINDIMHKDVRLTKNPNHMPGHTLNAPQRRRELLQIMQNNGKILDRIQARRGVLDRRTWEEHALQHQEMLHRLAGGSIRPARDVALVAQVSAAGGAPSLLPPPGHSSSSSAAGGHLLTLPPIKGHAGSPKLPARYQSRLGHAGPSASSASSSSSSSSSTSSPSGPAHGHRAVHGRGAHGAGADHGLPTPAVPPSPALPLEGAYRTVITLGDGRSCHVAVVEHTLSATAASSSSSSSSSSTAAASHAAPSTHAADASSPGFTIVTQAPDSDSTAVISLSLEIVESLWGPAARAAGLFSRPRRAFLVHKLLSLLELQDGQLVFVRPDADEDLAPQMATFVPRFTAMPRAAHGAGPDAAHGGAEGEGEAATGGAGRALGRSASKGRLREGAGARRGGDKRRLAHEGEGEGEERDEGASGAPETSAAAVEQPPLVEPQRCWVEVSCRNLPRMRISRACNPIVVAWLKTTAGEYVNAGHSDVVKATASPVFPALALDLSGTGWVIRDGRVVVDDATATSAAASASSNATTQDPQREQHDAAAASASGDHVAAGAVGPTPDHHPPAVVDLLAPTPTSSTSSSASTPSTDPASASASASSSRPGTTSKRLGSAGPRPQLKLSVYDVRNHLKIANEDLLCSAKCSLDALVAAGTQHHARAALAAPQRSAYVAAPTPLVRNPRGRMAHPSDSDGQYPLSLPLLLRSGEQAQAPEGAGLASVTLALVPRPPARRSPRRKAGVGAGVGAGAGADTSEVTGAPTKGRKEGKVEGEPAGLNGHSAEHEHPDLVRPPVAHPEKHEPAGPEPEHAGQPREAKADHSHPAANAHPVELPAEAAHGAAALPAANESQPSHPAAHVVPATHPTAVVAVKPDHPAPPASSQPLPHADPSQLPHAEAPGADALVLASTVSASVSTAPAAQPDPTPGPDHPHKE